MKKSVDRNELWEKLTEICRDVFEDDELNVFEDTTAANVENWDSLTHLSLIHELETEFKIKFTMGEIQGFQNVGELVDTLIKHMEKQ